MPWISAFYGGHERVKGVDGLPPQEAHPKSCFPQGEVGLARVSLWLWSSTLWDNALVQPHHGDPHVAPAPHASAAGYSDGFRLGRGPFSDPGAGRGPAVTHHGNR